MDAHTVVGGFLHPRDHVSVAGNEDEVGELLARGVDDQVRHEPGVHSFLGAPLAPLDELAGAQLHPVALTQSALVAVRAGVGYPVIPVLAVNGLV